MNLGVSRNKDFVLKIENSSAMTKMSKLIKFLIKIMFIPVKLGRDNSKATFKLCSPLTLSFIMIYFGGLYLIFTMKILLFKSVFDIFIELTMKIDVIDTASIFVYQLFFYFVFPLCPLVLASALPSAPSIALARDLKWPRNGKTLICSFWSYIFGTIVGNASVWVEASGGKSVGAGIVSVYGVQTLETFIVTLCWLIPCLLVSAFMEKFISICKEKSSKNCVEHAQFCLDLYSDIQTGFGSFFLCVFSITQLFLIFTIFLAIAWPTGSNGIIPVRMMYSFGVFFVISALMSNIIGLTLILDDGFKSLKGLTKSLQEQLTDEQDASEKQRIQNLCLEIKEKGPLNGKGLFDITRGTLTGMISVGITYIIILVQFRKS